MPNLKNFDIEITENYRIEAVDREEAEEILEAILDGQHVTNGRLTDRKEIVMEWRSL